MRVALVVAVCAVMAAGPAVVSGGQLAAIPPGRLGIITGTVWRHDDTPVAHALVRLRNGSSGRVVATAQADLSGRFSFAGAQPGDYLVEVVDKDDHVQAVGQTFSLAAGETVATFIRLGTQVPWFDGFFANAAAAALASAASLGVTAVGNGAQPASARF